MSADVPPVKGYGMNGQKLAFHWGLPVDSAGQLPDGRDFKDVRQLKAMLAKDEVAVAELGRAAFHFRDGGAGSIL